MVKGIGVDIVELKRIDLKIARKILSSKELELFNELKDCFKQEFLAERFAVKEALFKADNKYFNYDQITLLNDEKGRPYFENVNALVSIAHDGGMVVAFVVING